MDTLEIVKAARSGEIDSTWRVYVKAWSFEARLASQEDAESALALTFAGRLEDDDWRITVDDEDPRADTFVLWVRLWTVESEWKRAAYARAWAVAKDEEADESRCRVVERNSRAEHVLRAYGLQRLAPSTHPHDGGGA